jgi:hypothetical protein
MGKFHNATANINVLQDNQGDYTTTINGQLKRVNVFGIWRTRPRGQRLFTREQIIAIRASTDSFSDLARQYGCSFELMRQIKYFSIYRDV